jgi:hypothetical protein
LLGLGVGIGVGLGLVGAARGVDLVLDGETREAGRRVATHLVRVRVRVRARARVRVRVE